MCIVQSSYSRLAFQVPVGYIYFKIDFKLRHVIWAKLQPSSLQPADMRVNMPTDMGLPIFFFFF